MLGNIIIGNEIIYLAYSMTDKWLLTEEKLKQLLLVTTVKLNVLKNDSTEDLLDETSKSTDTSRDQATAQSREHDKTRS